MENYKTFDDFLSLKAKRITTVDTERGYMQVLEYILQDYNYLHVVQWHYNHILEENTLLPKRNDKTFFRDKENAMKFAETIGKDLLKLY